MPVAFLNFDFWPISHISQLVFDICQSFLLFTSAYPSLLETTPNYDVCGWSDIFLALLRIYFYVTIPSINSHFYFYLIIFRYFF